MRIFLLSDIHANLEALNACLDSVPQYDCVVNLGDVVGYGADPNAVVELVRGQNPLLVRGNHDKAVSGAMDLDHFNPMAGLAALWTRDRLTPDAMEWLRALPQGPVRMQGLEDTQFVHGSPLDEDEYVVSARDSQEPLATAAVALTFFGHTHRQGGFSLEGEQSDVIEPNWPMEGKVQWEFPLRPGLRYLINPGSAGQPRDDDWRAAFAVFDTERRVVEFYRVPYDVKTAQEKILAAQLPPRLAARLASGR